MTMTPDSTEAEGADGKYYIDTADQLNGLLKLMGRTTTKTETNHILGAKYETPASHTFEGKTIYFNRDFVMNTVAADGTLDEATAKQTNQIRSNGVYFSGTIDGQNHVIQGIYQKPTSNNRGFFGPTYNGTFKNFSIVNGLMDCTYDTGKAAAGLNIFGCGNITYENLYIDIDVKENPNSNGVGAYLGYVKMDSAFQATVTTTITFIDCVNAGNVSAKAEMDNAGGFIGKSDINAAVIFTDCMNIGTATAANNAGAFIGNAASGSVTFTNCENTGANDLIGFTAEGVKVVHSVPYATVSNFSSTIPAAFTAATTIKIEGGSCVTDLVNVNSSNMFLLKDPTNIPTGAAAHGGRELAAGEATVDPKPTHFYLDPNNVKDADGNKTPVADAFFTWEFTTEEAGKYSLGFEFRFKVSSSQKRYGLIIIDGQTYKVGYEVEDADRASVTDATTSTSYLTLDDLVVELAAGKHTITYKLDTEAANQSSWHFRDIYLVKAAD